MAKFVSKRAEFRLIIRPADRTIDESRRPVILPGERVEFRNHVFTTKDEGLINYLVNHPLHNRAFTIAEGGPQGKKKAMEFGARSTMSQATPNTGQVSLEAARATGKAKEAEREKEFLEEVSKAGSKPLTKDEVGVMIDQKLDDFFFQMKALLKKDSSIPEPSETMENLGITIPKEKKARVFTCNQCNKTFTSGFAVGLHKREEHK